MESINVEWTRKASNNIKKIYFFIAQDSQTYARRFTETLVKKVNAQISSAPKSGRLVPEFTGTPLFYLREVIFNGYRIIYDPSDSKKATIITVIHGRMDLSKHINSDWVIE